jgi:3-hydroxyisobutyrate dehydrogenase
MHVLIRSAMRSLVTPAWTRSASMSHVAADQATVGFVGLGNMGLPMAINLLKTGYKLAVCDRVPAAVEQLTSQGAFACSTPRQLSELPNIRAIITMLPSTDAVREVYQGADGILSARNGLNAEVLIDSSTIYPQYVRELAAAVAATSVQHHSAGGTGFVDAPVSGGVPGARAGTLTFMVRS